MKSFGTKTKSYTMELLLALCLISFASVSMGDLTIDNGQPGTSSTGSWAASGATGYYGTDSLWARNGATYTWAMSGQSSETYEVLMWWTAFPSRASAVSTVITHAGGQQTLTINQQENGGQWNSLGTYTFNGTGSVRITAANGDTVSTCADAVWFKTVSANNAPIASIDSITPNPAESGREIQFTGHGTDSDGTIAAYNWESSIDGVLSNAASFSASDLSEGLHTIIFEVQDNDGAWSAPVEQTLTVGQPPVEVIIDNGDVGTTSTGTWAVSGASGAYGTNSIYAQTLNATYTWRFTPATTGAYKLAMWWTALSSRNTSVPVSIQHSGGTASATLNQTQNGGQWNEIGQYTFNAGTAYNITIRATTETPPSTCADAVKFTLMGSGNVPPIAVIDSITPNPANVGQTIQFSGHGTDSDGTIAAYNWESNIDGALSSANSFSTSALSQGVHTIIFEVQDDDGEWSSPVQQTLTVGQPITEVIIDNGSPECSYMGTWAASGAPNPYGTGSIYAQTLNATYTWRFTPATTGAYKLAMWWTALSSRNTSVPVSIQHSGGTASATLNQTQNGGQWNQIGEYTFNAGTAYNVTITATTETPPSTCADAVKFTLATGNIPPTATITSINPNPASLGQSVNFSGTGTDTDGTVTAYSWSSSIDGALSTQSSFSKNNLSAGSHTISFRVQDNLGAWSQTVTRSLVINEGVADTIIDNGSPNCTYTGSWEVSGAPGYYGTDSVWSRNGTTYTWRFTPAVNGNYEVSAWWTQYPTRSNNVPIDIYNAGGTNRVTVNQQTNGGKWNSLGTFPFVGGVTYNITVTAAMGSTISTCADAVKFVYSGVITIPLPPKAEIISILPNPTMPNQATVLKGNATDGDGTVTAYRWRSSISGVLGTAKTLTTSALTAGTHTVYFSAQDNSGLWSPEVSATVDVGLEHIYIVRCYGGNEQGGIPFENVIQSLGGTQTGTDEWRYTNTSLNKTFYVHFIKNNAAVIQALARDGAHLILTTHSNYGLGPAFATATESANEYIEAIRYVDDDRFIKIGTTAGCGVSAFGMRTGQAYPFWWPNYKDGKNAIMPYDFNDPNGSPPYNYYLTYQIPGEPNHYKVQTVHNAATQRFSDSGKPAWYSVTGETPDPNNPEHKKHFITNSAVWRPTIESSGTWIQYQDLPKNRDNSQYFKENYVYNAAGSGNDFTRFMFTIPLEGQYKVRAWWPGLATNATNAPFRIYHSSGSTLRTMNQTINGKQWNDLGTYTFTPGDYSVLLTDAASSGNVVADGVQVGHIDNPPDVVQSDFLAISANFPLQTVPCGPAPLIVMLVNAGTGDLTGREWDCGDGTRNTTRDMLTHEYINPGIYTVSLTVKGPLGSSTKTKVGNVIVWPEGSPITVPLTAEFACYNKFSSTASASAPFAAVFMDASRGDANITNWQWNFGDGQTSEEKDPIHVYTQPGNYTVSLTVRNSLGATHTETKPNYIRVVVFEKNIDNVQYPKGHYSGWAGKTIVKPKSVDITREQCKFNRMLLESCNSADYYIQTIGRGLMFYTVGASAGEGSLAYLRLYLQGRPDQEIWEATQQVQAVYDYYNFNLPPASGQQQSSSIMMSKSMSEPAVISLSAEQQTDIDAMKSLSLLDTFEILGEPEYMTNDQLCNEAIAQAYSGSEYEAVELALARVKEPMEPTDDDGIREMKTARSILAQFPDVSVPRLAGLYPQYDVSVNVNLITAAGALAGEKEILEMLIKALDDETLTIDKTPDLVGQPLRICDVAYNQLVLNLKIENVLRTIGTGMTDDVRDYHIDILKGNL